MMCFFFESFFSIFGDSGGNCGVFFPDFNLYQKPKDLTVTNDAGHCPEELARQMGQHHLLPLFLGAADMVTLLEKIAGERVNQHFFILRIVVTVVVNFKQLLGCPRTGQQWENQGEKHAVTEVLGRVLGSCRLFRWGFSPCSHFL